MFLVKRELSNQYLEDGDTLHLHVHNVRKIINILHVLKFSYSLQKILRFNVHRQAKINFRLSLVK